MKPTKIGDPILSRNTMHQAHVKAYNARYLQAVTYVVIKPTHNFFDLINTY